MYVKTPVTATNRLVYVLLYRLVVTIVWLYIISYSDASLLSPHEVWMIDVHPVLRYHVLSPIG